MLNSNQNIFLIDTFYYKIFRIIENIQKFILLNSFILRLRKRKLRHISLRTVILWKHLLLIIILVAHSVHIIILLLLLKLLIWSHIISHNILSILLLNILDIIIRIRRYLLWVHLIWWLLLLRLWLILILLLILIFFKFKFYNFF